MNRKYHFYLLISVSFHVSIFAQNRCSHRGCSSKPEDLKNRGSDIGDDFGDKYREPKEDSGDRESYNRKPVRDSVENKPLDTHSFRDDYNPTRGINNPKPVTNTGHDAYKPVDSGIPYSKPDSFKDPGGGESYNRKPVRGSDGNKPPTSHNFRDDYNPVRGINHPKPATNIDDDIYKPVDSGIPHSKPDSYEDPGGGESYNRKPVRGSDENKPPTRHSLRDDYNPTRGINHPKPATNTGQDTYKPVNSGIPHTKPKSEESGYGSPHKPYLDDVDSRPVPERGYRPKPFNRPSPDEGHYRPEDISRPAVPAFPNRDLGGYYKPKDDDYTEEFEGGTGDGKSIHLKDADCICVPYYQCKDGHIVTDGAGIIDARKRPDPNEELPLEGKLKPPSCGPFHVCCNTPETSTVKPYEHRCGVRNPSGINSRILSPSNKGEADFGEWPWQAAVLKAEGKVNIFQCGGVLIDKLHVLTVAHCVFHLYKYEEYPLKVRLGEWDTQTTSEFLAHEDYRVSKIIVHPEYRNTSLWNDVAILRLEEAVLFAPHIDTICLPKYDEIFADQICVVTGWGKDAYKGGTFSNIMKEVALQVIDDYKCEEMLRKTRLGRFFQLHEGFLCAGGELGLDSCKGDGGGPLVCYRKNRSYALAGIVSWGIDCGQPGVPGVYVKIQKYLEWISKSTGIELQEYWPKS